MGRGRQDGAGPPRGARGTDPVDGGGADAGGPPAARRRVPIGWLLLACAIGAADQATKLAAESWLVAHRPVPVVPTLDLMLTYNTGAAFSLLDDAGGWQRWFFVAVALLVGALLLRWLAALRAGARWTATALSMILGGAAGNLIDRLFRDGRVVDFLYFHVGDFHWPAFNLADSAICVGAAILVVHAVFGREA